ncbi:hypothetical protein M569_07605, partial [Genlisea aurea]
RSEAMEGITQRLSVMEDLYFPRKVQPSDSADSSGRKLLLRDLLSTDAAVFLERYGSKLSLDELKQFEVLKEDYEINWHLNRLRSIMSPTDVEKKSMAARIKNRRLAYLNKLMTDGNYFSEEAMREREPYLHHEYVGRFQDPIGRSMARPGERWSETLMRRSEEAYLVEKIRGEQRRLGVAQSDWLGNERTQIQEEEEEEEEEEGGEEEEEEGENEREKGSPLEEETDMESRARSLQVTKIIPSTMKEEGDVPQDENNGEEGLLLSSVEMEEQLNQFTHIMHQKFLSGEDHQHLDYSKIDGDETLDDHWLREANQDAEEKYF